jgi:hypothetical protein
VGDAAKRERGRRRKNTSGESAVERAVGDSTLHETDITVYVEGRAMTRRRAFNIAWSVLGHLQVDDVRAHYRDALPSSSLGPFLRAR